MKSRTGARLAAGVLASILFAVICATTFAADKFPYLGRWSNGRGETLTITRQTLRFAQDKAVPYRDVTRATDGARFELKITAAGEVNAFPGKIIALECEGESMEMATYRSHADFMQESEPQSKVTWFRDE